MPSILSKLYFGLVLERPYLALLIVASMALTASYFAKDFRLDASGDSLVLETDQSLAVYRETRARYGSDDFLFIAYTPHSDLFAAETLADISALRDELRALDAVSNVTSLLDVPLIESPQMTFGELQEGKRTLEDPQTDTSLARIELTTSPLYRDLLVSADASTTAIRVDLVTDAEYARLSQRRAELLARVHAGEATQTEQDELHRLDAAYRDAARRAQHRQQEAIGAVRAVLAAHADNADIHLGGVPMVASDMIDFIRSDMLHFGLGVTLVLVLLLGLALRRIRWVVMTLMMSATATLVLVGFLGAAHWPVTVVSSNFVALMLIITLALNVHLLVQFLELQRDSTATLRELLVGTIRSKFWPSLYTVLTTQLAFASLVVSDIRPVIDFGWMMFIGVLIGLFVSFIAFPASVVLTKPVPPVFSPTDSTATITRGIAAAIRRYSTLILVCYAILVVVAGFGITHLTVENRFINYFKPDTEIYRGMLTIDRELGGTLPLDVVIGPPPFEETETAPDPFDDLFAEGEPESGISGSGYWFNVFQLPVADEIHAYLDERPETGKVLSISTTMSLLTRLNGGPLDNLTLAVMYKRLPEDIAASLFDPYLTPDGNHIRFAIRVIDSDPDLRRDQLIQEVHTDLVRDFGLDPAQIELTGMLVLYNNVLQSLFRSQILTVAVVLVAIVLMLFVLFRSLPVALVGAAPTTFAVICILGVIGWSHIPLDIMTITIAAITIGIGVDNSIHYLYRVRTEYERLGDYWRAIQVGHTSVGRAIFYTSITVALGFSILVFSNFVPTIYFGFFTALAMLIAFAANLTLLPLLVAFIKPFRIHRDARQARALPAAERQP